MQNRWWGRGIRELSSSLQISQQRLSRLQMLQLGAAKNVRAAPFEEDNPKAALTLGVWHTACQNWKERPLAGGKRNGLHLSFQGGRELAD